METMTQLNRCHLRGIVGSTRITEVGERKIIRFILATNYAFKDGSGCPIIETTWTNITAFESDTIQNVDLITRGTKVSVIGRLRSQRYTKTDGTESNIVEVIASDLTILPDDTTLTMQQ